MGVCGAMACIEYDASWMIPTATRELDGNKLASIPPTLFAGMIDLDSL
jgi:hypothetical protein